MPPSSPEPYPLDQIRAQFPALQRTHCGRNVAYFDGPGGSQILGASIDAMAAYMRRGGANLHGHFPSSDETEQHIQDAREAVADLVNADPSEIAFGANATSLAFSAARALSRDWKPGDEIVVTELDHRGNVDPWVTAAADRGTTIRWIRVDPEKLTLDLSDLDTIINKRTVLVAAGLASNAVGTISDLTQLSSRTKEVGALFVVDAVQAVPHLAVDRDQLAADVLMCSLYKVFGPHVGAISIRRDCFEKLNAYKVAPASGAIPWKLETGTQNHEGMAAIRPAIEFIASLGREGTRRQRIISGYQQISRHESRLADRIRAALAAKPGVRLYQAPQEIPKTPTISFTLEGMAPEAFCRRMIDEHALFIASGGFYASTLVDKLGLGQRGGLVRIGLSAYNSDEEVTRFIEALESVRL